MAEDLLLGHETHEPATLAPERHGREGEIEVPGVVHHHHSTTGSRHVLPPDDVDP